MALVEADATYCDQDFQKDSQMHQEDKIAPRTNHVGEALQNYGKRFGSQSEEHHLGFNRKAFPWTTQNAASVKELTGIEARIELEKHLGLQQGALSEDQQNFSLKPVSFVAAANSEVDEESDGEDVVLCRLCRLPLGEVMYKQRSWCSGIKDSMHGECMALDMAHRDKEKNDAHRQKEKLEKRLQHEEYSIGWRADHIPRNDAAASKLAIRDVPQGMVCLVLDEESRSIRVASTAEPAAALNLEYLSTALAVRRLEGHEPVFSLDPVDATDKRSMQEKVFTPDWLAGTSAGEVLFQADYHLKELSMGEQEQPIVGMKSCFHYSEQESDASNWTAREWFMVRKAEIHITDNSVLIPFVKMGVEAREQVLVEQQLEDLPITRPDHPMVRYAEAFTQNFDLIAERKSVIYHLRELAKTSIVAKFMLDADVKLDESWFHLAQEKEIPCCLEVPQLWNKSSSSQILVHDGTINGNARTHGVFGGVQFGLDKFNLSSGISRATPATAMSASAMRGIARQTPSAALSTGMVARTPSRAGTLVPGSFAASLMSGKPSGVHLVAPGFPSNFVRTPSAWDAVRAPALLSKGLLKSPGTSASLAIMKQPSRGVPGLGAPIISGGRIPGAPGFLSAAAMVGRKPETSPLLAQQKLALGLTRADLLPLTMPHPAALSAPAGPLSAAMLAGQPSPVSIAPISAAVMAPRLSALVGVPRLQAAMQGQALLPTVDAQEDPNLQGVDLRLDNFDLSSPKRVSLEAHEGTWAAEAGSLDDCVAVGGAFWSCLDEDGAPFKEQDRTLLQHIFNPALSDRRMEGDCFAPPDATYDYVQKLRALVKEEEMVQEKRKEHFFNKSFTISNPGALYPASWSSGFEASRSSVPVREAAERPQCALHLRPEYKGQAAVLLLKIMQGSVPVFDRSTEDGERFRIYQRGTLEIRTTQTVGKEEEVGVVLSIQNPTSKGGQKGEVINEQEKIAKATQYVESASMDAVSPDETAAVPCHYYLLLETENGHKILTERFGNGKVTWEEDPTDLEDRNSLAKVTRTKSASAGLTVRDMKVYHTTITTGSQNRVITRSACKRYAQNLYSRAVAAPGSQATAMPARSARLASEARKVGRPPAWAEITMAPN